MCNPYAESQLFNPKTKPLKLEEPACPGSTRKQKRPGVKGELTGIRKRCKQEKDEQR